MNKLIITIIFCFVCLLVSGTPLFRVSKRQRQHLHQGMQRVARPRYKLLLLVVLAVIVFFVAFFFPTVGLSTRTMTWEKDRDALILFMVFGTVFPALLLLVGYWFYANHILYDGEKILRGRAFRKYEPIAWTEIARMEVVNENHFRLYDRDGCRRVSVDISYENYENFRRLAQKICRPERQVMSDNETAYQQKFAIQSGKGILRRRAGEYFLIPALFVALIVLLMKQSGSSLSEIVSMWSGKENYPQNIWFLLITVGPVLLTLLIPISMLMQQMDYDTQGFTYRRFLRKTLRLQWREIRKIELGSYNLQRQGSTGNLRVTFYYGEKRSVTIYQHVFRKGFPEFEGFLKKMIAQYQIPAGLESQKGK